MALYRETLTFPLQDSYDEAHATWGGRNRQRRKATQITRMIVHRCPMKVLRLWWATFPPNTGDPVDAGQSSPERRLGGPVVAHET